jgi:hypothetical protein
MRKIASLVCALGGLWLARGAHAQDAKEPPAPAPDLDFLEYLGTWQADDDEWLVSEEWQKDHRGDERRKRADKGDAKRSPQARDEDDEDEGD